MSYSIKRDILLDIKYTFLQFLQGWFSDHSRYTWTADPRTTKILILDKNAIDLGIDLIRPAIVLNRNNMAWSYVTGNQNAINTNGTIRSQTSFEPTSLPLNNEIYRDLLAGTITFTVLSKNGVEAEKLASMLFSLLTAYKSELRANNINKITNLNIGPEQIVKQNSEHELIAINVNFSYYAQQEVRKDEKYNYLTIKVDGEEVDESFDYTVDSDGQTITFDRELPTSPTIIADYIDAVTLNENTDITLESTADELVYKVPDPGVILGYYVQTSEVTATIQSIED